MKFWIKLFITTLFFLNYNTIFSQTLEVEINEIKSIFHDFNNKILKLPVYYNHDNFLVLPAYFTNSKDYYVKLNKIGVWPKFIPSKAFNLNAKDCRTLNYLSLNDSSKIYIQKKWFTDDNIIILSDSNTKLEQNNCVGFVRPIFFRNFTRCLIAIYYPDSMDSFFLKKNNKHWEFDKFYIRLEEDKISK